MVPPHCSQSPQPIAQEIGLDSKDVQGVDFSLLFSFHDGNVLVNVAEAISDILQPADNTPAAM